MTTLKQKGRQLLTKRDLRGEAVCNGVKPKRGMWINRGSKTYGQVLRVRRDGVVVWRGEFGEVKTDGRVLVDGGYFYSEKPLVVSS